MDDELSCSGKKTKITRPQFSEERPHKIHRLRDRLVGATAARRDSPTPVTIFPKAISPPHPYSLLLSTLE